MKAPYIKYSGNKPKDIRVFFREINKDSKSIEIDFCECGWEFSGYGTAPDKKETVHILFFDKNVNSKKDYQTVNLILSLPKEYLPFGCFSKSVFTAILVEKNKMYKEKGMKFFKPRKIEIGE
jgi:hypothetical protein